VLVVFIITAWPKKNVFLNGNDYEPLLAWKFIQANLPWGVILLVGKKQQIVFFYASFFSNTTKSVT